MKDRFRWLPFLLINIFVSAVVTGAILFWYDRTYRQAAIPSASVSATVGESAVPAATIDPDTAIDVQIVNVIGAGILDTERVSIHYGGEDGLSLAGWHLQDEDKNIFTFPQLTLYADGAVQVHTGSGQDTVVDFFWNSRDPIWESGEEASLVDPQGNVRATYTVP